MEKAASNPNGAANGFMGIGMMNMVSGGMGSSVMQNAFNPQQTNYQQPSAPGVQPTQQTQPAPEQSANTTIENTPTTLTGNATNSNEWVCPTCGSTATGKFCGECGTKKPQANVCPNCGTKLTEGAKFCGECGTKIQ